MALAALVSTSSAINAALYGGANISYILAKEGCLPMFFERKVWKKGTEGLFITSGLVILVSNSLTREGIGMLVSTSLLIIYLTVNASFSPAPLERNWRKTLDNSDLISEQLDILWSASALRVCEFETNFGATNNHDSFLLFC